MFDYRLFFPSSTLDDRDAGRRPSTGRGAERRVHHLPARPPRKRNRS